MRRLVFASVVLFIIGGLILYEGGRLIWLGRSGGRAQATVGNCDVSGAGRSRKVDCTGAWTVGGSLLEGGHVVTGSIIGAETDDVGKTLDVTIIGEEAYTASFLHIALPIIMGLGCLSLLGGIQLLRIRSRR
jgi:hypothetical protein